MTARDDILAAALALTGQGRTPFSPAQLIAEARKHGCAYKDSTLRTHIVGIMCIDANDHWATKYSDLRRVGRGQYQLVVASDEYARAATTTKRSGKVVASSSAPTQAAQEPAPDTLSDAKLEWSWEGNVQAAVVTHLASQGWAIKRVADTASGEQGVDIEAARGDEHLVVEVKGYPSATYVRGPKAGQAKPTSAPLQARHYFSNALLSAMLMRSDHPRSRVALAFPDRETYRTLARRTAAPLSSASIEVWLVTEDGHVESGT